MPNIERQISKDNLKVLENNDKQSNIEERTCDCKIKDDWKVNGMGLTKGIIYQATHNNKDMSYIGSTGRQFKSRYDERMHSFRNKSKKETTKLSKYIHSIQIDETDLKNIIKWEFMHKTKQNSPGKICSICNL